MRLVKLNALTTPVERIRAAVQEGDPAADAFLAWAREAGSAPAMKALQTGLDGETTEAPAQALLDSTGPIPDHRANNRGARFVQRHGLAVMAVFKGVSLPLSYANPAANKPLARTGRLTEDARRRLDETARFTYLIAQKDGLRFGAPGHRTCLQVRLMHARVRHRLRPDWDIDGLGVPINVWDMAFTQLLFGLVIVDGLRALGVKVSSDEARDVMGLVASFSALLGLPEAWLCPTEATGRTLFRDYRISSPPPDQDARDLTRALFESSPPPSRAAYHAVAHMGLGPLAAQLGIPPSPLLEPVRRWAQATDSAGGALPQAMAAVHNALVDRLLRSPPPSAFP